MNRVSLAFAVLRYLPYAAASICAVMLAWLLAPLLALTAFGVEDKSTHQGNLPTWLRWFQTHDFPLDEVWRPSTAAEPWRVDGLFIGNFRAFAGRTPPDFYASAWLRYLARVFWLWRNPAYGFRAQVLGYPVDGMLLVHATEHGAAWGSGLNSWAMTVAERPGAALFTRSAFHVRGQLFYWRGASRYVRVNVGWKLVMPQIAMVATHVNPIRRWEPTPSSVVVTDRSR